MRSGLFYILFVTFALLFISSNQTRLILNAQVQFNGLIGSCNNDYGKDIIFFPDDSKFILSIIEGFGSPSSPMNEDILVTKLDSNNNHI